MRGAKCDHTYSLLIITSNLANSFYEFAPASFICPRSYCSSQNDKHSGCNGNGCCRGFPPQFPYPRPFALENDRLGRNLPRTVLFFLYLNIISHGRAFGNSYVKYAFCLQKVGKMAEKAYFLALATYFNKKFQKQLIFSKK